MSRHEWLGIGFCFALTAGTATARQPATLPPLPDSPAASSTLPAIPPQQSVPEPVVKDLTPPGFTDIVPPAPTPGTRLEAMSEFSLPPAPNPRGWYGDAEFLLMRTRSDNLDYVIHNGVGGLSTTGPIQSLAYNITPGLRTEIGYRFANVWDASFAYTYLSAQGNQTVQAGPGQTLLPTLTRPGLTDFVLSAHASAVVNYNLFDMQLGRRFVVDEHLAVRAFGGFRFANIQQSLNATYDGGDASQAAVYTGSTFRGFGPLVGGELVFGGWHGFHVYARTSEGLLAGRSSNTLLETNNGGSTVYANVPYNVQKVVPVASIGIGGGWQHRAFTLRFGYEVTEWIGLNERVRFTDDVAQGAFISRPGNLSFEGLFVQMQWNF
jgi:hypothetical protein